ncbi:hypothetical protein Taro_054402 [Colocasia esculenta]|uniref:Uncharacterized protein n=1 Tax=Colocasia esculenta TaxID=4460 RepID=A0A843XQC0_COLES|nr:hypothetical protein [Colocasia esculenta]
MLYKMGFLWDWEGNPHFRKGQNPFGQPPFPLQYSSAAPPRPSRSDVAAASASTASSSASRRHHRRPSQLPAFRLRRRRLHRSRRPASTASAGPRPPPPAVRRSFLLCLSEEKIPLDEEPVLQGCEARAVPQFPLISAGPAASAATWLWQKISHIVKDC